MSWEAVRDNAAGNVLSTVLVGAVVTGVAWGRKVIEKRRQQPLPAPSGKPKQPRRQQPITSKVHVPKTSVAFALFVMMLVYEGWYGLCDVFHWAVTTIPQWPFGRPLPEWAVIYIFGPFACFICARLMLRTLVSLFPTKSLEAVKKPVTIAHYDWATVIVALALFGFLVFSYHDPFGWRAASEQRWISQINELQQRGR